MRPTKMVVSFQIALIGFLALMLMAAATMPPPIVYPCHMEVKALPTLEYQCTGSDCSIYDRCPIPGSSVNGGLPFEDTTSVPGHTLYYCRCDDGSNTSIWCGGVTDPDFYCQSYVDKNNASGVKSALCMDCGCSINVHPPDANDCRLKASIPTGFCFPCECPPPPHD